MSHDALRLMLRHGTALVAMREDEVRCYTASPVMPDTSEIVRKQMRAWGDLKVAEAPLPGLRLGDLLSHHSLDALRGIEGSHMRRTYQTLSERYGIS